MLTVMEMLTVSVLQEPVRPECEVLMSGHERSVALTHLLIQSWSGIFREIRAGVSLVLILPPCFERGFELCERAIKIR